ncbi:right-handed parallel beta-helix repeat-containing protein [Candidatus Micrarchaeota archaeon]|nr:right-handed parallel beta-helix repeat-containing protein [Candidatus Micrarchaeota archaeon]
MRPIFVLAVLLALVSISFSIDVSSCQVINSPGTYDLINSFGGSTTNYWYATYTTCILVNNTQNVIIDCHGYSVNETAGTSGAPIAVRNSSNVVIQNCNLNGARGVAFNNVNYTNVTNNNISANWAVVSAGGGYDYYNLFEYNDIAAGTYGFFYPVANSTIRYNNVTAPGSGAYLFSGNNLITDNYAYNSPRCYGVSGDELRRNIAYNCSDSCYSIPYTSGGAEFINNTADTCGDGFSTAGGEGALFQDNIIRNSNNGVYLETRFSEGIDYARYNVIDGNQITNCGVGMTGYFDILNNFTDNVITGSTLYGIQMNSSNNDYFSGNIVTGSTGDGVVLNWVTNTDFIDETSSSNGGDGLHLESSTNNLVDPSYFCNNTGHGIALNSSSSNNINDSVACNNTGSGMYLDNSTLNNITNNTVYNNTGSGIYLTDSSNNTMTLNDVYDNAQVGVGFTGAPGGGSKFNDLFSNNIYGNRGGVSIISYFATVFAPYVSNNNVLSNNEIYDNTEHGVYSRNSVFQMSFDHLYNNGLDMNLSAPSDPTAFGFGFIMANAIIDNPTGTYQNFTNLTIGDYVEVGTAYTINWSNTPAALPPAFDQFKGFIEITNATPGVIIDGIQWKWHDGELAGFDENNFELWEHDGSWSEVANATLTTGSNNIIVTNLSSFSSFGILQNNNCPIISAPGSYTQGVDYVGAPNSVSIIGYPTITNTCIYINSSDVIFDCDGYTVTHDSTPLGDVGITFYPGYDNITLLNCEASLYEIGLFGIGVNGTTVQNNTFHSNYNGVILRDSYSNILQGNVAYNNSNTGFLHFDFYSSNLVGNTAYNNTDGIAISTASGINASFNTLHSNLLDGFLLSNASFNRLSDNVAYNNSDDGFDLVSYNSTFEDNLAYDNSNHGFHIQSGMARSIPYYSDNSTVMNNTAYGNTGNGFHLTGDETNALLEVLVVDNVAYGNENGFYLNESDYITIYNNTAHDHSGEIGFWILHSEYNNFTDNTAYENGDGFSVYDEVNYTNLTENTAYNNTQGIRISDNSTYITLTNNEVFDNGAGIGILDSNMTSVNGDHLFGNAVDMYVANAIGSTLQFQVDATNVIFDNPLGNYTNFTNLSFSNVHESDTAYAITWDQEPVSNPLSGEVESFENKFVNISKRAPSEAVSLDSVIWHWTDTESAAYNEDLLELRKHNATDGWVVLNNTPDTGANTLSLTDLDEFSTFALVQNNGCPAPITAPGTYQLMGHTYGASNDVSEIPEGDLDLACIKIASNDVVFDCNGFNITNNGTSNSTAFAINGSLSVDYTNVTIQNCPSITNYSFGAYLYASTEDVIDNVTIYDTVLDSIYFLNMTYSNVTSSTLYNSAEGDGVSVDQGSNNVFRENIAYNNYENGIYLEDSPDNQVLNNTVYFNNDVGVLSNEPGSLRNLVADNIGYENGIASFAATYGANDNVFTRNWAYNDTGFAFYDVNRPNVTFNRAENGSGMGMLFLAPDSDDVGYVFVSVDDLYVASNYAFNYMPRNESDGYYFYNCIGGTLINNTLIRSNDQGFDFDNVYFFNVTNNTAQDVNEEGGFSFDNSTYNFISDNIARGNGIGFILNQGSTINAVIENQALFNNMGILLDGNASGNYVLNNTATSNLAVGYVAALFSDNNQFIGNTANNGTGFAFYLVDGNIVESNTVSGGSGAGISLLLPVPINDTGFVFLGTNNSRVFNNTAYDYSGGVNHGFFADASSGNNFTMNTVYDVDSSGFWMQLSDSNNFTRNIVYNSTDTGMYVDSSENNQFVENEVYNNAFGFGLAAGSQFNYYMNNTAHDNDAGFRVDNSNSNTFTINQVFDNNLDGIYVFPASSNNNFTENEVFNNTLNGFFIGSSDGNALEINEIHDNLGAGVNISDSNLTTLMGDHIYNNNPDFVVDGTGIDVALVEVVFDNPVGNLTNFTNLSVTDNVNSAYSINWAAQPSVGLPGTSPGARSFLGKFVNITNLTSGVVIDNLVWHWTDAETVGYTEGRFEVRRFVTGIWATTPDVLDTGANTLTLSNASNFSTFAILEAPEDDDNDDGGKSSVDVSFSSTCDGNVVRVIGTTPKDGFTVLVDHAVSLSEIASGTTNEDGEFEFPGCGIGVKITVKKSTYFTETLYEDLIACPLCDLECGDDLDCEDNEHCVDNMCELVDCDCGEIENHQCNEYQCCSDADCPEGLVCQDNSCTNECTSDADCESTEFCNIEEGAEGGSCEELTGQCGYADNHVWNVYECGEEGCPECPEQYVCEEHICEPIPELDGPETAFVGESGIINATEGRDPCIDCDIVIRLPDGSSIHGKTDSGGQIKVPLNMEGKYTFSLVQDGETVDSLTVDALVKPQVTPEKPPTSILDDLGAWLLWLLLLLVLVFAFVIYRRRQHQK